MSRSLAKQNEIAQTNVTPVSADKHIDPTDFAMNCPSSIILQLTRPIANSISHPSIERYVRVSNRVSCSQMNLLEMIEFTRQRRQSTIQLEQQTLQTITETNQNEHEHEHAHAHDEIL
jgi:hypothetical protein